jgi:Na+-transporting NADH:ubiquinone oxidoreductase subunit C
MNSESPLKAFMVVLAAALVASSLVSAAVVLLRPYQLNNQLLDRGRNIVRLTGMIDSGVEPSDEELLGLYNRLDARTVDLDTARFNPHINPHYFDQRSAVNNPALSTGVPPEQDSARLGRRSRFVPVYLVWEGEALNRIILPVHGKGMWSMLYGYVALQADLNTIAAVVFYEQNETPGLGDQVMRPTWLAQWRGRKIYDERGDVRFAVSGSRVDPESSAARYSVDALTGATVTADAVTGLMRYWFGPHGYQPFLERLHDQSVARQGAKEGGK